MKHELRIRIIMDCVACIRFVTSFSHPPLNSYDYLNCYMILPTYRMFLPESRFAFISTVACYWTLCIMIAATDVHKSM